MSLIIVMLCGREIRDRQNALFSVISMMCSMMIIASVMFLMNHPDVCEAAVVQ
jgi:competence protein ComGC